MTLRSILSALTALFIGLLLGPWTIRTLASRQIGQIVRQDGPASHLSKAGTPTMGGSLILVSITASMLLWGNLANVYVWIALLGTLSFGALGWFDDYLKLHLKTSAGLSGRWKYLVQSFLAIALALWMYGFAKTPEATTLVVPFLKHATLQLGWVYIILSYFVITGSSNAVNLTDGLDGLAILPIVMVAGALSVFAYLSGNITFASYLHIPYIAGSGEIAVFCAAIVGAGLGFLWFNTYPAQVFMGDVGALGLGAGLGIIAIIVRQELIFFLMSGVFVTETVSVMLQVCSFKVRKKRLFNMAPIHHHFELKGWPEPRVTVRLWIITAILVLCGLASLKLR